MNKNEFFEVLSKADGLIEEQKELMIQREHLQNEIIMKEKRNLADIPNELFIRNGKYVFLGILAAILWFALEAWFSVAFTALSNAIGESLMHVFKSDMIAGIFYIFGVPTIIGVLVCNLLKSKRYKKAKENHVKIEEKKAALNNWFFSQDDKVERMTQEIKELSGKISEALDGSLSPKFCFYSIIMIIDEYFRDNRVEGLSDALNLYVYEYEKPADDEIYKDEKGNVNKEYQILQSRYRGRSL